MMFSLALSKSISSPPEHIIPFDKIKYSYRFHIKSLLNLGYGDGDAKYYIVPFIFHVNDCKCMNELNRLTRKFLTTHFPKTSNCIFFQTGDCDRSLDLPGIVFQESCCSHTKGIPFHFNSELESKSITMATKKIGFQGAINSAVRKKMYSALKDRYSLTANKTFFYAPYAMANVEKHHQLRAQYIESIYDTQFILCPRGGGRNSIRFFETLSAGRIPILISDDIVLPLSSIIDYGKFIVRVPEDSISNIEDYLPPANKIEEMSIAAANTYKRYFHKESLRQFLLYTLKLRLAL